MTELTLWPESSLAAIEETARRILCEVGVDVQSAAARELLLSAGCTLLPGGRVAVPWDVVERSAAAAPRRFTLAARDDARSLEVSSDGGAIWAHPLGGAHSVADAVTGELRRARAADAAAAARVQHHLRRPDMVTPLFTPGGLQGDLEPLVSYLICLQESDKCVSGPPLWSVEQVRGVCRLADLVLRADRASGRYSVNLSFSPLSPLTLGASVANAIVEAARLGASCVILPCPVAGTTAPAPIAAAVAQQAAEALAGVVLAEAANPGTPVTCASRLMPCDPQTGLAVMGGPELALASQAATSIMRRLGLPADVYGLSTDSKVIDAQFGFERALGALIAATARPAYVSGMGFMQTGVGGSLEALAIDDEILRYIAWSLEERPADAAAMDVDAVKQAVSTSAGFLGLRQTRSYLRTESVQRKLAHSGALSLAEWSAGGHDLLGRARDVVDAALAQPPLGLDAAVIGAASDTLVETAEHMGVEPPDLPLILESFRDLSRAAVG